MIFWNIHGARFSKISFLDEEEELLLAPGAILRIIKKVGIETYIDSKGKRADLKTAYAEIIGRQDPILPE